jgi:hypothetical protein
MRRRGLSLIVYPVQTGGGKGDVYVIYNSRINEERFQMREFSTITKALSTN